MQNSEIAAYVAFPFTLLVFAYHHYHIPACFPIKLCSYIAELYIFVLVLIALFVYVAFKTTLFVLTLVDLHDWATWCWRWSVGGAFLFNSISVIAPSDSLPTLPYLTILQPLQLQLPQAVFIINGPAIPKHAVAQYLTVGLITVLQRKDWLRLGTSCAKLLSVVLIFWTNVAFVVEQRVSFDDPFPLSLSPCKLPIPTLSYKNHQIRLNTKSCPYACPTRNDIHLFNMSPLFIKDKNYRHDIQESIAKKATTFVLAVDLYYRPSLNLAKSMVAQPGLLVVYRTAGRTTEIINDKLLETPQRVKDGFEKLLQKVDKQSKKQD
ncbi:hypothetical protein RRF57_009155 [Xylaria bambusicola]|uniref:Uncharacterized protein n=1 Tax=Xylaria bambusicola TaxID=326684 RepID=A0AAN7ZBT5_9PEZI